MNDAPDRLVQALRGTGLARFVQIYRCVRERMTMNHDHARRTSAAYLGIVLVALASSACTLGGGSGPSGGVRFQGVLSELASGASVRGGRETSDSGTDSPRSLGNAAVSIAALPIAAGGLEAVEDRDVPVNDDGSFEVDVDREPDTGSYVLLANTPGSGVGLEQALGWLELPVGGERSTGWPVDQADDGTIVELGAMSGTSGSFIPGTDPQALYETLGADQTQLLFAASRDNALKSIANRYLNRTSRLRYQSRDLQTLEGTFANARNTFSPAADALVQYTYQLHFEAEAEGLTWLDFQDGQRVIEIVPPAEVTTTTGGGTTVFGPTNPIRSNEFWPNGGVPNETDINGFAFLGPPPDGLWTVNLNGEKDLTVDLSFGNLFDSDGNLLYFVPSIRINVGQNDRIESFELRFLYWDDDVAAYRELDGEIDVPVLWTFMQTFLADSTELAPDEELAFEKGVAQAPSEFYWPGTTGERTLKAVHIAYDLGVPVNVVFESGGL